MIAAEIPTSATASTYWQMALDNDIKIIVNLGADVQVHFLLNSLFEFITEYLKSSLV